MIFALWWSQIDLTERVIRLDGNGRGSDSQDVDSIAEKLVPGVGLEPTLPLPEKGF